MKRKALFFVLVAMVFGTSSCKDDDKSVVTKEGEFTVLAYNIAGLPAVLSSSKPAVNTIFISERVNPYEIVHAQEDFNYNNVFYSKAKHTYRTEHSGGVPIGDGLNTLSQYPILDLKRMRWAACTEADCLTPKGFTYSKIKLADGVFVDFYNIHCNAGSENSNLFARRQNILQICEYIKKNSAGKAIILMGDTNTRYTRTGDNIRELLALGFKDAWVELIRGGVLPTQDGNSLTDCDANPTSPNCEVVDKILYRSSDDITIIPTEFRNDSDKFLDDKGEWLSDHMPLYAKFSFKTN